MADATPTNQKMKKTRNRAPREFVLCRLEFSDGKRRWTEVDPPEGFDPEDKNNRAAYRKAVRAALEAGKNVETWNGRQFDVIATVDPFMFSAQVEEIVTRTVKINES